MVKKEVIIQLKDGFKPEALAYIVQTASMFRSKIYFNCAGKQVNAKSIMGMMTFGVVYGEEITVIADGSDENNAIEKMLEILG